MKSDYIVEVRKKIGHMPMFNPVATLIVYKEGKVLLQKRSDNNKWAIHGGGLEFGETFIEALNREIKEELNIEPINPALFGIYAGQDLFHIYPDGDESFILNHVFICEDYRGELKYNDGEVLETKWFDLEDLPNDIHKIDIQIIKDIRLFLDNGRKPIVR